MVIGVIIGVIIGLVLIFSLLSIIVSQVNTFLTNLLKTRTHHLREGIRELLVGDAALEEQLLKHPLIRVETDEKPSWISKLVRDTRTRLGLNVQTRVTDVTWLNKNIFAESLIYLLIQRAEAGFYNDLYEFSGKLRKTTKDERVVRERLRNMICGLQNNAEGVTIDTLRSEIEGLDGAVFCLPEHAEVFQTDRDKVITLLEDLSEVREAIFRYNQKQELVSLLVGVDNLPESDVKKSLKIIIGSSKNLAEAGNRLETWFDTQMQRFKELYKRKMGVFSFVIGLIVAVALNMDTIQMARALWESDDLRAVSRSFAEQLVFDLNAPPAPPATVTPTPFDEVVVIPTETSALPLDFTIPPEAQSLDATADASAEVTAEPTMTPIPTATPTPIPVSAQQVVQQLGQLSEQGLPIGWYIYPRTLADCGLAVEPTATPTGEEAVAQSEPSAEPTMTPVPTMTPMPPPECDDKRNIALLLPLVFDDDRGRFDIARYDFGGAFAKIIGIFLTTMMIAQGAPFWFALLEKLVTGKNTKTAESTSPPVPQPITINLPSVPERDTESGG